jgi:hypothetical protein
VSQRRGPGGGYRGALGGGGGGAGGPANAGARGALLLAVAVILGIVLLQKFDTGPGTVGRVATATSAPVATTSTTRRVGLTTVPLVTTTTVKARAKADVKVLVANGAGVKGLGAATTSALKNLGYATLTPTDTTVNIDKTSIQYAEGYDAEAREVAVSLSLAPTVAVKLSSPPVAAADIGDAKVIVILGADATTSTTASTAVWATTTTNR